MGNNSNRIRISGTVEDRAVFSHSVYGESFYSFKISSRRRSGTADIINVTISERLFETIPKKGEKISIKGQIRTYNENIDGKNHLKIVMFCLDSPEESAFDVNEVFLDGFICRKPYYRISPSGREICDIMLAVNRLGGKSDYIPCIAWGRNARFMETMNIGDRIQFNGRFQSREYRKPISDGSAINKTAYEVSVISLEKIDY